MTFSTEILEVYRLGTKLGIINGCGQKGGISFSEIFSRLKGLPNFIPDKGKTCFMEIEKGCGIHDILCEFGGTRTMKFYADAWFSAYVSGRLSWTRFWFRIPFVLGLFYGLHTAGRNAGNFDK